MKAIDALNLSENIRELLEGRIDNYLLLNTGDRPNWLDLGQCELNNKIYGLSLTVQRYIVEYEILYDESQSPANQGEIEKPTHKGYSHLPRCNDAILLQLVIEDGLVKDVKWKGQGCTMCVSATSIMTKHLIGKNVEEVDAMAGHFQRMMLGQESCDLVEQDLLIFQPVSVNPAKVECIFVPWEALKNALRDVRKGI